MNFLPPRDFDTKATVHRKMLQIMTPSARETQPRTYRGVRCVVHETEGPKESAPDAIAMKSTDPFLGRFGGAEPQVPMTYSQTTFQPIRGDESFDATVVPIFQLKQKQLQDDDGEELEEDTAASSVTSPKRASMSPRTLRRVFCGGVGQSCFSPEAHSLGDAEIIGTIARFQEKEIAEAELRHMTEYQRLNFAHQNASPSPQRTREGRTSLRRSHTPASRDEEDCIVKLSTQQPRNGQSSWRKELQEWHVEVGYGDKREPNAAPSASRETREVVIGPCEMSATHVRKYETVQNSVITAAMDLLQQLNRRHRFSMKQDPSFPRKRIVALPVSSFTFSYVILTQEVMRKFISAFVPVTTMIAMFEGARRHTAAAAASSDERNLPEVSCYAPVSLTFRHCFVRNSRDLDVFLSQTLLRARIQLTGLSFVRCGFADVSGLEDALYAHASTLRTIRFHGTFVTANVITAICSLLVEGQESLISSVSRLPQTQGGDALRVLDLGWSGICRSDFERLCDAIASATSLSSLTVDGIPIPPGIGGKFFSAIMRCASLHSIGLNCCDRTTPHFVEVVRKAVAQRRGSTTEIM